MAFGTARRIGTNFLSLFVAETISKILQALVFIFLARYAGAGEFGVFSFAVSFGLLFMILADFGLATLFVREISKDKSKAPKYLFNGMIIKSMLALVSFALAYLFLKLLSYPPDTRYVAYGMLVFAALQSFTELHFSIFRAFEKMHYEMFVKIFRMSVLVGAVLYIMKAGHGIRTVAVLFPLTEMIVLSAAMYFVYTGFVKASFDFDLGLSKSLVKESSVFCLSLIFATLYLYIDVVMLSKFRTDAEVGLYSAAANLIIALIFIPLMYGNSILPVISRFYVNSKKSLKFAYEKSFKYMLVLGLAISSGIYMLSDKIIGFFYGSEYSGSATVLMILSGYMLLKFLNPVTGFTLIAINKQNIRLFSQGSAALINIALNFLLIPKYGIIGAALATLITEIIFFGMYCTFITKYGFDFWFILSFVHKPVAAAAIMIFVLRFVPNIFVGIIAGALTYFSALLALRVIDEEDKAIFYKIIKNI